MATIRGESHGGSNSAASGTVAKVTGTVDGDRVIAIAFGDDNASATIAPTDSGWTLRGTQLRSANGRLARVYDRIAASDPASYAWSDGVASAWQVRIIAVGGVPSGAAIVPKLLDATTGTSLATSTFTAGDYVGIDPLVLLAWCVIQPSYTSLTFGAVSGADGNWGKYNPVDQYSQSYAAYAQLSGNVAVGAYSTAVTGNQLWQAVAVVVPTATASSAIALPPQRRARPNYRR